MNKSLYSIYGDVKAVKLTNEVINVIKSVSTSYLSKKKSDKCSFDAKNEKNIYLKYIFLKKKEVEKIWKQILRGQCKESYKKVKCECESRRNIVLEYI